MVQMRNDLVKKIMEHGWYDTKNYRYKVTDWEKPIIKRIPVEFVGRLSITSNPENWETCSISKDIKRREVIE